MKKYYINDRIDEAYLRLLKSSELAFETEFTVGTENFQNYLNFLGEVIDIQKSNILRDNKKYETYHNLLRKVEIKLEKLGFEEMDASDLKQLGLFKRIRYKCRERRNKRLMKRCIKLKRNYKVYIPEDEYYGYESEPEIDEENDETGNNEELDKPIIESEQTVDKEPISSTLSDTKIEELNESEKPLLDAFFNFSKEDNQ